MTPLLLTAAIALSGPAQAAPGAAVAPSIRSWILPPGATPPPGAVFVKPDLLSQLRAAPRLCNRGAIQALGPDGLPLKKLGELPPGIEEHAVLRMINGCPVREVVYAGQTYYLDAPTGGFERDLRGSQIERRQR